MIKPRMEPYTIPTSSMISMDIPVPISFVTMQIPPIAPTKQTKEPQDKSILPPVSMHISIPVARIYT